MYRLSSKDIDPILDKYTEKVNSKTGYYKIPYDFVETIKEISFLRI